MTYVWALPCLLHEVKAQSSRVCNGSVKYQPWHIQSLIPPSRRFFADVATGSMSWQAYVRFGVWMVLSLAVYCLYSVHSTDGRYAAVETHNERYEAPSQGV